MTVYCVLAALLSISNAAHGLSLFGEPPKPLITIARERYALDLSDGMSSDDVERMFSQPNSTITENWVELPIDHFAECSDTFRNRYFVHEKWYQPGGPVFIYDMGEETADYIPWIFGQNNYFTRLLKEFNGMGIGWEHRYYGKSYPDDNFSQHTIEQALADLPAMAAKFSRPNFPSVDLTPASTPWIFTGGSYSGVRAAMSRLVYPDTFFVAWAGSAPVQMQVNMSVFWEPIEQSLKDEGYSACIADIQAGTKRIDHLLNDDIASSQIKQKFFGAKAASWSNFRFASKLTWMWYAWTPTIKESRVSVFCDFLESDAHNNTAPPEGWASTKSADWVMNHMSWARNRTDAVWHPGGTMGALMSDALDEETNENAEDGRASAAVHSTTRSWNYQACTQCGYMQCSEPAFDHWISNHFSLHAMMEKCHKDFPGMGSTSKGVHDINKKFGGWHMRPSNTFWTADEVDSWRTLSPLSGLSNAPPVNVSTEIPACGAKPSQDEIFGYILPGRDHADEFFESKVARYTQDIFTKALRTWLPHFPKTNGPTYQSPPKCAAGN